jgi:hypothetical protein
MYKVSSSHDRCSETKIDQQYETHAIRFGGLARGTCSENGFTVKDGTHTTHMIAVIGPVTLTNMKRSVIGEATSKLEAYVSQLWGRGNALRGSSLRPSYRDKPIDDGGSVLDDWEAHGAGSHDGHFWVPAPFQSPGGEGEAWPETWEEPQAVKPLDTIPLWRPSAERKPSYRAPSRAEPQSTMTMYRILGAECTERRMDNQSEATVLELLDMRIGACKDQGFTLDDGIGPMDIPVLGSLIVSKFRRPTEQAEVQEVV